MGDLETAAAHYLNLGFRDVARPDHDTILLAADESPYVDVMLERHPVEAHLGSGPVFRIEDVEGMHASQPDLNWVGQPVDIPTGKYAIFRDPDGNPIRVVDFTADSGRFASLFRPRH
ncbi:VOC family protein [Stackebrandtia nassauensis]|uniref:VOC family protein n=1 Tax=Stackebrandtia nassauensis TaxID=283811 RepID=UPI0001A3ADA3|nr:glyoxalase/bleomycin resistance/dioxygenase family protein [Stackebrandtia nassauensis]